MTAIAETRSVTAHDAGGATGDNAARPLSARLVERFDPPHKYNLERFRMRHMAAELLRTLRRDGVLPGCEAPDFELESTNGKRVRLRHLRGQPVLLHFVSYT
jgi:hypothetical protein